MSAQLDAEDDAEARLAVAGHLEFCASCREWQDKAALVTRLARTTAAQRTPDVVDRVLARAPRSRDWSLTTPLRLILTVIGLGQLCLGVAHIYGATEIAHHHTLAGATLSHFSREFAAWNIALGIGFVWVAMRTSRAPGLVPTLTVFVLLLTALEVFDIAHGHIGPGRLVSHTLVQAGFIVVLILNARLPGSGGFFSDALQIESTRTATVGMSGDNRTHNRRVSRRRLISENRAA